MRWILYAPLFTNFLAGLVQVWRSPNNIPMNFVPYDRYGAVSNPVTPHPDWIQDKSRDIFPTAINILLGGPQQFVCYANDCHNSINLPETFALYLVALLMLWGVIIMPWILLQIFLDYAGSYN